MELPDQACISCAHLLQSDRESVSLEQREQALVDENNRLNNCRTVYQRLLCGKLSQDYPRLEVNDTELYIKNDITKPNSCKDWAIFQNVSAQDMEPKTSYKLARISIMVARKTLAIALFGMVMTFFITLIIWYLD